MRIPNLYLGKYQKSLFRTEKVKRTITKQKPYIQKASKIEAEMEQELQAYMKRQEIIDKEYMSRLNDMVEEMKAKEISYFALLIYGIKLDKDKIREKLKARKAK